MCLKFGKGFLCLYTWTSYFVSACRSPWTSWWRICTAHIPTLCAVSSPTRSNSQVGLRCSSVYLLLRLQRSAFIIITFQRFYCPPKSWPPLTPPITPWRADTDKFLPFRYVLASYLNSCKVVPTFTISFSIILLHVPLVSLVFLPISILKEFILSQQ